MWRIVCSVILILILLGGVALAENSYDKKVCQRLLSSNWNQLLESNEEPIIVYNFYFKKLNSLCFRSLEGEFVADEGSLKEKGDDLKAKWSIIKDDKFLKLVNDYKMRYTVDFSLSKKAKTESSNYSSWLMTEGNNPVSVKISDDFINLNNKKKEYIFEISFTPEVISIDPNKILTEVNFKSRSGLVQLVSGSLKTWIAIKAENPAVIICRKTEKNNKKIKEYYALYLTAAILPVEEMKYFPVSTVGDIAGLNKFIKNEVYSREDLHKDLGIYLRSSGLNFKYRALSEKRNLIFNCAFNDQKKTLYNLSLDYVVFPGEKLFLSSKLANNIMKNKNSALFLGLSDQVEVNNLNFKLAYYPFNYDFKEGELIKNSYQKFFIAWQNSDWNLCYEGSYFADQLQNKIAFKYNFSDNLSIETIWYNPDDEDEIKSIGLVWNIIN